MTAIPAGPRGARMSEADRLRDGLRALRWGWEAEGFRTWKKRRPAMLALIDALLEPPVPSVDDDAQDMCPNCVTPWKCNGPHLWTPDREGEPRDG